MNRTIRENLMGMMGRVNPWTGEEIGVNDTYNNLLFCYLHFYHRFGDVVFRPNDLPSYTSIDRVIRDLPNREKNVTREEEYREEYSKA